MGRKDWLFDWRPDPSIRLLNRLLHTGKWWRRGVNHLHDTLLSTFAKDKNCITEANHITLKTSMDVLHAIYRPLVQERPNHPCSWKLGHLLVPWKFVLRPYLGFIASLCQPWSRRRPQTIWTSLNKALCVSDSSSTRTGNGWLWCWGWNETGKGKKKETIHKLPLDF